MISCVFVGDCKVGKTALIKSLFENTFSEKYNPTDYDETITAGVYHETPISVNVFDLTGILDAIDLGSRIIENANVIVMVYSVTDKSSFINIAGTWLGEVRKLNPTAPIVLVANKCEKQAENDVAGKDNDDELVLYIDPVLKQQGLQMAKMVNAVSFVESSARVKMSCRAIMESVLNAYFFKYKRQPEHQSSTNCVIG